METKKIHNLDFFPNFILDEHKPLGSELCKKGYTHFHQVVKLVHHFGYKRISNLDDLSLVLEEKVGTCSSKHGYLKALAEENNQNEIKLKCAYFEFQSKFMPQLKKDFEKLGLTSELEGHCYLSYHNHVLDITTDKLDYTMFIDYKDLLVVDDLPSNECGHIKQKRHEKLFKEWCQDQGVDFEKAWDLRWRVIKELVQGRV